MGYGERLKKLRLALGLSQRQLADKFRVGHAAISQWESGARKVSGPIVVLLEMMERDLDKDKEHRRKTLKKIQSNAVLRTLEASKTLSTAAVQSGGTTLVGLLAQFESGQELEKKMWEAVGNNLVEKLGEFKGLYMKVGQMMSYLPFVLPEESRSKLEALQCDSTPLDSKIIEEIIKEDLGKSPQRLFKEWNSEAFSAASIGQVHRARLADGTEVAVKVQYPKVQSILKADLSNAMLAQLVINVIYRKSARGTLMKEMKERFLQECDYELEAKNQRLFGELFSGRAGIRIPKIYSEYCSERVLTMEFMQGQRYAEFVKHGSQEAREQAATTLYRFAYESIFKHRVFNCDPHPGNYLFDGGTVAFIDFGCVKTFKSGFVDTWVKQQRAILENRQKEIDDLTLEMGLVSDVDKFDFEYHRDILRLIAQPLLEDTPYRFTMDYIEKTWRKLVIENPNRHYMNLPADWLFTNRLQWGLFSILAGLKADVPCRQIFLECIEK
jgi:predicted unusual protein kinase regulating ubiquinone biosynthesis (AarF/ABC1/UbiB family)/DNA-binding XRE family transcriptional regulator